MNASDIVAALRREIVSERIRESDRLPPERELATRFGVARGTIREALRRLEGDGYVKRRAGSGTYVAWTGEDDDRTVFEQTRPLQLVDVRRGLEPHAARLAVLYATAADLESAEQHIETMEACEGDVARFADADERFHLALAACAQNPLLMWMLGKVHEVRAHRQWAEMRTLTLTPEIIEIYNRQHRAIVAAIRARDAEGAAEAMRRHLSTARQSLEDFTG